MSASIKFIKDGNNTVYPVTIADAIIDPNTGEPLDFSSLGGAEMVYTINGNNADSNGNFTVTAESLGAAITGHTHGMSDINGLDTVLAGKAVVGHTHTIVNSIEAGGSTVTGDVELRGTGNIQVSQRDNVITLRVTPYSVDTTTSITASDSSEYKIFVGTEAEWAALSANIAVGDNYIVFIRS
jgi:hypothetical protein